MLSLVVNEFPICIRQANGTLSQVSLAGSTSNVQNVTVLGVSEPVPEFSLIQDSGYLGVKNADAVVIHVEPVLGAPDQRKLTFSGAGAPNGLLKPGAYMLFAGEEIVGRFQVLFAARKVTREVMLIDQQQQAAFQASLGANIGQANYNPEFDADLDGSVNITDLNELGGANQKVIVKR